jgi:Metallo-beta-lactamase superfamily
MSKTSLRYSTCMSRETPPLADELEVSVIGPGRGECIIVHLGDNEWCIVDSCVARGSDRPAAVEYLEGLAQGALEGVRLIVATHWHDDHIRGIASVLRACTNARFSCSAAMASSQFVTLVQLANQSLASSSGTEEFGEVFKLLGERKRADVPHSHVAPAFATENKCLLTLEGMGRSMKVRVEALSPSDGLIRLALQDLSRWLPKAGDDQRRIVDRPANDTTVVLWIEAGQRRILLGGDLEYKPHAGEGWLAVLAAFAGQPPAEIFKVAHHGSPNADCDEIWQQLLYGDPLSILTPFSSGQGRPQKSDLDRLKSRTKELYLTYDGSYKPPRRDPAVEKEIKKVPRRALSGQPGHVRIRWPQTGHPTVELFNGALKI